MDNYRQDQLGGFVFGLLLGTLIGASAAFLTAPDSGRKTRKRLGKTAVRLRKRSGDRWDDLAGELRERVDEAVEGTRKRLSDS